MRHPEELMAEAIELAVWNVREGRGGPFAAIVVRNAMVIARGTNEVVETHDPTAHAEIVAIREACRTLGSHQLDGCEIYASCEPCPMCLAAAYWARVAEIVYGATREDAARAGFDDAFIYQELALPLGERRLSVRRLAAPQAVALFAEWTALAGRTPY